MSEWHPGSFTKNFSWGRGDQGLKELYDIIRLGFNDEISDVPRTVFRQRVSASGRPDYIPLNFFLYNEIRNGVDFVVFDELAFQAVTSRHSSHFDRLALFAFNLSKVGRWKRAAAYQERPALWAFHYIADRLNRDFDWDSRKISADDIEKFVSSDSRYVGKTSRKLATNLNYLYKVGKISGYSSSKPERWWLSALFLTLDRTVEPEQIGTGKLADAALIGHLMRMGFSQIGGRRSIAKDIATTYFTTLYSACGGRIRFSNDKILDRERILVPNHLSNAPPENGIVGVFHPTNPSAKNSLPSACKILARYAAGFEVFDTEDLDDFDVENYIKNKTQQALNLLRSKGIKPGISSNELMKLTRGE